MLKLMEKKDFPKEDVIPLLSFSEKDLVKLHKNGHIIGLHSHSHPTNLKALPKDRQNLEYTTNKEVLSSIINANIYSAAHPVNSYNAQTLDILVNLGIEIGFRSNALLKDAPSNLELPRVDHINIINKL